MKNTREHADCLAALLQILRHKYGPPDSTIPPLTPIERITHSFLQWECRRDKADAAYARLTSRIVDFNELRVYLVEETMQAIGERYPLARERCDRLKRVLNDIYRREFCISLDAVVARGARYTQSYISDLDGMTPYVVGQVVLLCCGAHAVPVDTLLVNRLVREGAVDSGCTVEQARDWLEHQIRAAQSLEVHLLFQRWVDDAAAAKSSRRTTEPSASSRTAQGSPAHELTKSTTMKKKRRPADSGIGHVKPTPTGRSDGANDAGGSGGDSGGEDDSQLTG